MKRILLLIVCVSLIPTAFADVNTPDKNAPSIQTAKDSNLPVVKNEQKENDFQLSEAANKGDIEKVKELIAKGYNVNIRDDVNWTPLHRALQSGHKEVAKLLIANGADVNAENNIGTMPVMLAVINNYNDITDMLIAKGAEKTIYVAAAQGDVEGVKGWLKKDPNLANTIASNDGWGALHWAAYLDHQEVIKVLIKNGADVNIRGEKTNKMTPLFWAVRKGRLDAAKLLIENGANVNFKMEGGMTVLHFPGSFEIARLLIDNGADVNAKGYQEITPLHSIATEGGLFAVQRVLFEKNGGTAITWQTEFEKQRNAAEKIIAEIAELLIKKGADANAKDKNGRTPLFMAAQSGQTELVKFLLQKGADANVLNDMNELILGSYGDDNFLTGQWNGRESFNGPQNIRPGFTFNTFRWTAGDAGIRWPIIPGRDYRLQLACIVRTYAPEPNVFVNGQYVATIKGTDWQFLDIPIPAKILDGSPIALVEIKGRTWTPKEQEPPSPDARNLGIVVARFGMAVSSADAPPVQNEANKPTEKNTDVNTKTNNDKTVLKNNGRTNTVQSPPKSGEKESEPNISDKDALLLQAAKDGNLPAAQTFLADGADVNAKNKQGTTSLIIAAMNGNTEMVKLLLENGANVKERNNFFLGSQTALIIAAENGHTEVVKLLLEKGADVNAKNNIGATALGLAKKKGHTGIVQLLESATQKADKKASEKESGPNISDKNAQLTQAAKNTDANTESFAMHKAAYEGNFEEVKALIAKGADVNAKWSDYHYTPLHFAVTKGHEDIRGQFNTSNEIKDRTKKVDYPRLYTDIVSLLLANGADVNAKASGGWTALFLATHFGYLDMAELLIAKGADVNAKDNGGATPLSIAALGNHKDIENLLMAKGAKVDIFIASAMGDIERVRDFLKNDPNMINAAQNDATPLHIAALCGQTEMAKFLVEKGADVNAGYPKKPTPLHFAALKGRLDMAEMLIEKGADVDAKDSRGFTPLFLAVDKGSKDITELLIAKGADINAKANDGSTVLVTAYKNGHIDTVKLLIEKGADISEKYENGRTALMVVCEDGHPDIVKLLIEKGVDVNAKNNNGKTALDMAKEKGHTDIVQLLNKAGAKE